MSIEHRKPLEENQVVIHVPKGTASHVKVIESEASQLPSEVTVQISKNRKVGARPVLGVIVK